MKCKLMSFDINPDDPNLCVANVIRLETHPKLGPPSGGITKTSRVKHIDFIHKVIITENSIYIWE